MNTLYYGDNLNILRRYSKDESVDLVYLDPLFNSNRNYNVLFKDESGVEADSQITAFEDTWHWSGAAKTYHELILEGDKVSEMLQSFYGFIGTNQMMAYLVMMAVRLKELHRVLNRSEFMKLIPILLFVLMFGCIKVPIITPESQDQAEKTIDLIKARELSDSIVNNLINDNRIGLHDQMEKGARDYYDEKSFASLIDQMFELQGKPLESDFKKDEIGRKTGAGGYDKPVRKFWYAVRTTKYEKGTVYLTVEVVPDDGLLASSGFSMVTFPLGAPPSMK